MDIVLRITVLVVGLVFTSLTYYLLIRKKVTERITLLWSLLALIIFVFSLYPSLLNHLAAAVGVSYPPALVFLLTILMLMFMVMYQSIQISLNDQRVREIVRVLALTQNQVTKLQSALAASSEQTPLHDSNESRLNK